MRRLLVIALLGVLVSGAGSSEQPAAPLRLIQAIPLDGVEGRIDHMDVDPQGQRLFIAALGNGTVEVLDLRAGRRVQSLRGFHEPQGLGFVASPSRLFVANGGDGTCDMLDGATFAHLRTLRFSEDADNIRCDASTGRTYVGYGSGALGVLDAASGDSLGSIPFSAHPEAFQLEANGPRAFVNIPDAGEVAVLDLKKARLLTTWKLAGYGANYPMALDEPGHRLFIGCRRPATVLVLDTGSGQRLSAVPIDGDPDDLFYDSATRQLFVSCGAGFIDVLRTAAYGQFTKVAQTVTAPGARTALYVPTLRRLFLAVPHHGSQRAETRVYEAVR
ncbi:MAG: hypothetical protein HYR73_09510 [Candidatus Eisenbacteria bacterium]|nr:hypothetical protein [Candidatus Eisenbacteria bacterium]